MYSLVFLIPVHYFKFRKQNIKQSVYLEELYQGTKDNAASKLYVFIFIVRRGITAFVLVSLRNQDITIK